MQSQSQIKIGIAHEIAHQIMLVCLRQCEEPDAHNLSKIGAYLGDFVNNLRSALNYTMRRFVEVKLKPAISAQEYKATKGHRDFPWAATRVAFDGKDIVALTSKHCRDAYDFLERTQPYNQGKEWLRYLMRISNRDKHEIINEVGEPTANAVFATNRNGTPHPRPGFFGPGLDRILVTSTQEPHVHLCPYYYYPYGAFAIKGGKWALFFISIDQCQLGLVRFIEEVPKAVGALINEFETLI